MFEKQIRPSHVWFMYDAFSQVQHVHNTCTGAVLLAVRAADYFHFSVNQEHTQVKSSGAMQNNARRQTCMMQNQRRDSVGPLSFRAEESMLQI